MRLAKPSEIASCAFMGSPVRRSSLALPEPMSRGRKKLLARSAPPRAYVDVGGDEAGAGRDNAHVGGHGEAETHSGGAPLMAAITGWGILLML
jgi:hypothetical protein